MGTQCYCGTDHRRELVRASNENGIDYLEVQITNAEALLQIHFIHDLLGSPPLLRNNIHIDGGVRIKGIRCSDPITSAGNVLTVPLNSIGDYSTYTFRLVDPNDPTHPPAGYDPLLSAVDFIFHVDRLSEFDCRPPSITQAEKYSEPQIDYLTKDYDSFSRLMLDRLSALIPAWQERNPADLGMALVEMLAYVGDRLSYFQDAVATEAYLSTARKRVSVHRHARLLDYPMHDGCNARVWIAFQVGPEPKPKILPGPKDNCPGTLLLTGSSTFPCVLTQDQLLTVLAEGAQVFETMHDLTLYQAHNEIRFFTWGEDYCCLPRGATSAFLQDDQLNLFPGDVLIFEERLDPSTGNHADADPTHRHAVRLTKVEQGHDMVTKQDYLEIGWDTEDALPFPLCVGTLQNLDPSVDPHISVALGNVVLADHGYTLPGEVLDAAVERVSYRPGLKSGPVTQQGRVRERRYQNGRWLLSDKWLSVDLKAPASAAFDWGMGDVMPVVVLKDRQGQVWSPQHDLLESDAFDCHFVVEVEEDESAWLRFGDGVLGQQPDVSSNFTASYRIGNGLAGNVGQEMINHAFTNLRGIESLTNPLPARGACNPEPIEQVRLYAPQAFRTQERAVTAEDYALFVEHHPDVQKAVATMVWTGSWHTVFINIDRLGGRPVDPDFSMEMMDYLEKYRLAGYDLEIRGPRFVPLYLQLTKVSVKPGYYRSNVKQALLEVLSNRDLSGGGRGFFHPDNFTFGQPVYLSEIYRTALQVAGVDSVDVSLFRWTGSNWSTTPANERLVVDRLEIVRLDNDPNQPENGKIEIKQLENGL